MRLLLVLARWAIRLLFVAVLVLSVGFSILQFIGGVALTAVSTAVKSLTGFETVAAAQATQVADLQTELDRERARRLQAERDHEAERRARAQDLGRRPGWEEKIDYRGQTVTVAEAVADTDQRVYRRSSALAAREVAGMAAQAVPFFGTAAIVGLTAFAAKDLCQISRDLEELRNALDPATEGANDRPSVCAIDVPTRTEIWEAARSSPAAAFAAVSEAIPDYETVTAALGGLDASDLMAPLRDIGDAVGRAAESGVNITKDIGSEGMDFWKRWNR